MSLSMSEVMWAWYNATGGWPANEAQLRRNMAAWNRRADLEARLRAHGDRGVTGPGGGLPSWAIRLLAAEVGASSAYLSDRELGPIIVMAAAEAWTPDKLQARIEATAYWRNRTSRQRQWNLLSPAEQAQVRAQWEVKVAQSLQDIWGPDLARSKGYVLGNSRVKRWADEIARGVQTVDVFAFAHQQAAEGIKGTPAYTARVEEFRRAGVAEVSIENLRGELEDEWRTWAGEKFRPPNLAIWAENIYMNRRSRQDFEDYAREVSKSLFPNKPEHVTYEDFIAPAREIIGRTLELGRVSPDDPLLLGYIHGEIPSLSEILTRARKDTRYENTEQARTDSVDLGFSLLKRWGVAA